MNLKENIARMEQELADMKKKLEQQKKLELKGGVGHTLNCTYVPHSTSFLSNDSFSVQRGAFRATKELTEIADRNMVTRNRLEAYAMQVEPEWRDKGINNKVYYICINEENKYYPSEIVWARTIGNVYMSKETAEILCKALNNGKIKL